MYTLCTGNCNLQFFTSPQKVKDKKVGISERLGDFSPNLLHGGSVDIVKDLNRISIYDYL